MPHGTFDSGGFCGVYETTDMSRAREFYQRPQVLMAIGAIFLCIAIGAFVTGGRGVLTGVVLTLAGASSLWRGFKATRT